MGGGGIAHSYNNEHFFFMICDSSKILYMYDIIKYHNEYSLFVVIQHQDYHKLITPNVPTLDQRLPFMPPWWVYLSEDFFCQDIRLAYRSFKKFWYKWFQKKIYFTYFNHTGHQTRIVILLWGPSISNNCRHLFWRVQKIFL